MISLPGCGTNWKSLELCALQAPINVYLKCEFFKIRWLQKPVLGIHAKLIKILTSKEMNSYYVHGVIRLPGSSNCIS